MRPQTGFAYLLVFALLLSACSSTIEPTATPLPSGGGSSEEVSGEPADSGSNDSGGSADLGTSGPIDNSTGLIQPSIAPPPSGAPAPMPENAAAEGSAILLINGELGITYTGGSCDVLGDETYITIPAQGSQPGASMIIFPGDALMRTGTLVWATSGNPEDNAAVSAQEPLAITLNADGLSGSFEGVAYRVGGVGGVATRIGVNGSFTCISHLIRVSGEHAIDLAGITCAYSPEFQLRGGNPSGNAVWLIASPGLTAGSAVDGGLSWRVGGVNYVTFWLTVRLNPDGVSGSYFGEAYGPDNVDFPVSGQFNCLSA